MAVRTLNVPAFDFLGGFYFPQIFERLVVELRQNVPEITNENEGEVAMQLLSAFAFVGHLNNVLIDLVAHETIMVTAQLRDSLVAHLKLIGFEVAGDIPAEVDLVVTLSKLAYTATTEVVQQYATFATLRRSSVDQIVYEVQEAFEVTRTDQLTACFVYDESADTYTDRTTEANTDAMTFAVLPATPAAGDILYVGHDTAMTNRLRVTGLTVAMDDVFGVWEYSDDELEDEFPDSVTDLGASLKIVVDSLLDTDGDVVHTGLTVRVTLNSTGATEDVEVQHDGTNNYVSTGFLGQVTPSYDERDYSVGTNWHRVEGLDDDTNDGSTTMELNGAIDFTLPQSTVRNWQPIDVDGTTAYWLRFRVVSVTGVPVPATVDRLKWNDRDTFVLVSATQGTTVRDEVLGSGDGTASQEFTLGNANVIDGTVVVSVDGESWTDVSDFLSSTSVDHHYMVEIDSDGVAVVTFGDGINGKNPPTGVNNVTVTYRVGANLNGNVGSDTIRSNRSGNANVKAVTNPRAAAGWEERRGNTAEDRERLKVEGPASLRTLGRAVTVADVEDLTRDFVAADGTRPFARAHAIEEGFGVKTVKVVTVGPAGATTSSTHRGELETYFNGDTSTGESGVMVANQRVFARDYTDVPINVTAQVTSATVTQEAIENALTAFLSPVAVKTDGITFRWSFGQTVTLSSIIGAIIGIDGVEDVDVTVPAANTTITDEELPSVGTLTITVVEP